MLSLFKTYRLSHYAWLALTAASLMINETSRASSVAPGEDDKIQAYQKQVRQVVAEVSGAVLKLYRFNPETGDRRFTGSSVVVSPDGLVLTVAHVNEPGRIYIGRFPDGREVHVKGLGEINSLDAAMMRIQ